LLCFIFCISGDQSRALGVISKCCSIELHAHSRH
jgi:hypothetical protein